MLSLAHVLMTAQLPVRLRVLVPAVENAISGNAYRPLDVLQTRAGITVEVSGGEGGRGCLSTVKAGDTRTCNLVKKPRLW